jgi:zinc transporter 9
LKVFPPREFNLTNSFLVARYGYSKERFVWSLVSAVGIFCLGSGAIIVDGFSNLWKAEV